MVDAASMQVEIAMVDDSAGTVSDAELQLVGSIIDDLIRQMILEVEFQEE